jgi:hypothetical protein
LILVPVALVVAACSAAPVPKPLPGGLPPEYEPPRAFELEVPGKDRKIQQGGEETGR